MHLCWCPVLAGCQIRPDQYTVCMHPMSQTLPHSESSATTSQTCARSTVPDVVTVAQHSTALVTTQLPTAVPEDICIVPRTVSISCTCLDCCLRALYGSRRALCPLTHASSWSSGYYQDAVKPAATCAWKAPLTSAQPGCSQIAAKPAHCPNKGVSCRLLLKRLQKMLKKLPRMLRRLQRTLRRPRRMQRHQMKARMARFGCLPVSLTCAVHLVLLAPFCCMVPCCKRFW